MSATKSLLYGVLVGSVIGGVSVLLSAPTSGKEIRKVLRDNQKQLSQSLSQVVTDGQSMKHKVTSSTKKTIDVLTDVSGEVKRSIEYWKQDIGSNQKNIQKELSEIENALQNLESTVINK